MTSLIDRNNKESNLYSILSLTLQQSTIFVSGYWMTLIINYVRTEILVRHKN